MSHSAISRLYGADHHTVARWSRLPEVIQEEQRIRREVSDSAARALQALQPSAVSLIRDVLGGGEVCETCGRGNRSGEVKDQIRAAEAVFDRTGLPKRQETVLSGTVGLDLEGRSDDDLAREILEEAAAICEEDGEMKLGRLLRERLRERAKGRR